MDCFIHQSYGRLRVRLPHCAEQRLQVPHLLQDLKRFAGASQVRFNQKTGSVVVVYDPQRHTAQELLKIFEQHRLLANVVGFPRAPLQYRHRPQKENLDRWISEALEEASKSMLRSLFELALRRGGQLILRKIIG